MSNLALPQSIAVLAEFHSPEEFKRHVLGALGDTLPDVEVMFNMVLLAIYIRPEKTKGGIIRPGLNVEEDAYQGKAGLVVKIGPNAFEDDGEYNFHGQTVEVGDWCVFKVGDAWPLSINGIACRLVRDSGLKLKVKDPSVVF